MFLEGPEPPFVSDAGWSGRQAAKAKESGVSGSMDASESVETRNENEGKRGSSKRGRDRGSRGGRGGGKSGREDHRKVTSEGPHSPALVIHLTNDLYDSLLSRSRRAIGSTKAYKNYVAGSWIVRRT